MLFWIFAAFLTLVAACAVLRPFTVRQDAAEDARAHDIEVYRDQLGEVERDAKRGLIGQQEAEQARAEISRRILQVSYTAGDRVENTANRRVTRLTAAAAVLAIPLVSWGLYVLTGSPGMPAQPLHTRAPAGPADAPIGDLVARAETHLAANPDDARGWQVLAPVYMRLGRFADAQTALKNIMRLSSETADLKATLGEAMVGAARGMVTAEAEGIFKQALALDPKEPKARFFLGLARAQEGATEDAQTIWRGMLDNLPEASPWREAAQQALAQSGGGAASARGPTEGEVAAASDLSETDRQAMIEGMVTGLDEKLRENPSDLEGWRRLIRSYIVLQRPEAAKKALERAVAAFGDKAPESAELKGFAANLGVTIE
ncbi:c-type cytochrome biogenesis protein CcmI [Nitratireductor kimnyeongensis]|uniref:C-type cytochrome biogenesis protein CcmI n=1 Tax=Nitratireductor kimnyeongensis TaxID=430679 RepID=A0ABW0T4A6_9HYPH|nr:c-type cytochrome biogenesis protein CcmI [Nitratireductor kimnyeongensis]QZZ35021.1 c-type cytochrome biogenesis protein CcmI [Nitratireductor kimnyeongensis]